MQGHRRAYHNRLHAGLVQHLFVILVRLPGSEPCRAFCKPIGLNIADGRDLRPDGLKTRAEAAPAADGADQSHFQRL
jgi:hypothetical protein